MRYIKLYEEFRHDEVYDVMMSICETVSFKVSERFPSTERVRVYETSERVDFDPVQYEEYLSGWTIRTNDIPDLQLPVGMEIIFVKGDLKEAGLSWLNEVYGNLKPKEVHGRVYYVDSENKPILYYYEKDRESGSDSNGSEYGAIWIDYNKTWVFFESYFGLNDTEIEDLMTVWLASEPYNLTGLKPRCVNFKHLDFGLIGDII